MPQGIIVEGIETNNLKNIDVEIKRNTINVIIGPSGSGKTSLAYETIAAIGLHELKSMYSDAVNEPQYKVKSYKNMLVPVPIKQVNNNNNIHSTIGTYFNLNQYMCQIFSTILDIEYDFFILNKKDNICPTCHGLGYVKALDVNRIIDYDKSIEEVPIKCWTRHKDFYRAILKDFSIDNGIDYKKKFRELSLQERNIILYGQSKKKYSVRYKTTNRMAQRTTCYYGVMLNKPMLINFTPNNFFFVPLPCTECGSKKYSKEHNNFQILGFSIGDVLSMPFDKLLKWLQDIQQCQLSTQLKFSLNQICAFISKAIELKLGHLNMNRSIPSLSGGELQRLRLVRVFNSQLNDLLIVLDEPLAGLSKIEKEIVYKNILTLASKHTLLIVDHHSIFFEHAAQIISIGEKGGKQGGMVINTEQYIKTQQADFLLPIIVSQKTIQVRVENKVYNYEGIDLCITMNNMNLITGHSGAGKTTLLREYLPQYFGKYTYINQKPLTGHNHSFVITALDIFNSTVELFAKKFNKDKSFFSNHNGEQGVCPECGGIGKLTYGTDSFDRVVIECKDCEGTGFKTELRKYRIQGKSIHDIWTMTISEAIEFYSTQSKKISTILENAQDVLLGYLQLGQRVSTLSGGENIRIKILKSLKSSTKIYGIDEPFKGLNNFEIYAISKLFHNMVKNGKTLIVVDHEEESFKYFSKHIEITNKNGWLVEK